MDTVRNMCDRHIIFRFLLPQEMPHLACNLPMQLRNCVAPFRISQGENAHAEHLALRHLMTCNIEELIARQFKLGPEGRKVFFNKPQWEFIVPCRNGCMGCENILSTCFFNSLFKSIATCDQLTCAFKSEERRMTFVHMPDGRVISERPQGADSADAK